MKSILIKLLFINLKYYINTIIKIKLFCNIFKKYNSALVIIINSKDYF